MPINKNLQCYARAHLLRADPGADPAEVDLYVSSSEFATLAGIFDHKLGKSMKSFLSTAGNAGSATPETTPVLSQPTATPMTNAKPMKFDSLEPAQTSGGEMLPASPAIASGKEEVGEQPPAGASAPISAPQAESSSPPSAPAQTAPSASAPLAEPASSASQRAHSGGPLPPAEIAVPTRTAAGIPEPDLADIAFRLPNARAGEPYAQALAPIGSAEGVVYCEVEVPSGLNLVFDKASGIVRGTPELTGEHAIAVIYHFARQSPSRKRRAIARLIVNPDPKTMWLNQPSDQGGVYWKPDEECGSVEGADLRMIAASKRGRSHAHVGSFRDDDYALALVPDSRWHIGIVSDGAGGSKYSRKGAAIICEEARAKLQEMLAAGRGSGIDNAAEAYHSARAKNEDAALVDTMWHNLRNALYGAVGNAAYYAAKGILEESNRRKDDLKAVFKDYSSTALISICKRYPFGTLCAAYWVGDGAVGIYSKKNGITLLGEVDSGEYSGQTRFLESGEVTQDALMKRTRFDIVDDMTALILMTDGVSDPKFETEARLTRSADWNELWSDLDKSVGLSDDLPGKEQKLLAWLDFWSQGNHDDRTIAIIY